MNVFPSFSAADLIKRSSRQIKFLREHPEEKKTTQNQLEGTKYQHRFGDSIPGCFQEMRTTLQVEDIIICACHDIYDGHQFIEVKNVEGRVEQWYFEAAILQAAFYKALFMESDGYIVTSKFYQEEGHPKQSTKLPLDTPYLLKFGKDMYAIQVNNSEALIQYFYQKAKSTFDWFNAQVYDSRHKNKHYQECKHLFSFTKIETL